MDTLRRILADAFSTAGSISSRQLQDALGISRQSVWSRIRPLVASGELVAIGVGRGVRYFPGSGLDGASGAVRGENHSTVVWSELARCTPRFAYLSLAGAPTGVTRRADALAMLASLHVFALVVVDFLGIPSAGPRFIRTLFFGSHANGGRSLVAINACEAVRLVIERERRLYVQRMRNPLLD